MDVVFKNKKFIEVTYGNESDFEADIVANSKTIFGQNTIFLSKKRVNAASFGMAIPDGFLLDFSDSDEPKFYIVEIELEKHSFFGHIFPQITKFFAFYVNNQTMDDLASRLYKLIISDTEIKENFEKISKSGEIFKCLKDAILYSKKVIMVIDGNKHYNMISDMDKTYNDTWKERLTCLIVKRFCFNADSIFVVEPSFGDIPYFEDLGEGEAAEESKDEITPQVQSQLAKDISSKLLDGLGDGFVINKTKQNITQLLSIISL